MVNTYLTFGTAILLWLTITCGCCFALLPYSNPITSNGLVTSLLFFNNLNIFIAICEICLGYQITFIQLDYRNLQETYRAGGREWEAVWDLMVMPLTFRQLFDTTTWARMWSTYALFDPSYQNHESFGFFIDVGNGWTTIGPCVLLNVAMLRPDWVNPLWVGCVTIAAYWQMLYGTIIYFLSFLFNRRYIGHKPLPIASFVTGSNGIWIIFPGMAIYAAVVILRDGNFNIFEG